MAPLADQVGYSEREMYHRLKGVYETIGADSRTEALILASRWGVLAAIPARDDQDRSRPGHGGGRR